jgi:hypothetical protein
MSTSISPVLKGQKLFSPNESAFARWHYTIMPNTIMPTKERGWLVMGKLLGQLMSLPRFGAGKGSANIFDAHGARVEVVRDDGKGTGPCF